MNPALERHREQFEADPTRTSPFEALEEHYFLEGDWPALVGLYWIRLGAADVQAKPNLRSRLLFRLGQVFEERCLQPDDALACYAEAARLAPDFQPALRALRTQYAAREQWELALQVGELEARTPMRTEERAAFHASQGAIWLDRLQDPEHALTLFKRALADDPQCLDALRGGAASLEALGRGNEAVPFWERLVDLAEGEERTRAMLALAHLFETSLQDQERALDYYARTLAQDPENGQVVEAMLAAAVAAGRWELVGDLSERRFDLASGAQRRVAVALETAEILLDRGDTAWARAWLERAADLAPEHVGIALGIADAAGRLGDAAARAEALERAFALAPDQVPADTLFELAGRRSEVGDHQEAIALLRGALDAAPDRVDVLDALVAAHQRAGRHDELVELLESRAAVAGEDDPARARALAQLGALHERHLDDPDAAREAYGRAFDADPTAPGAAAALDRLYRKCEDWESLHHVLDTARQVLPEAERPPLLCGLAELLTGPRRNAVADADATARRLFEEALRLEPTSSRALKGLERLAAETGDEGALLSAFAREAELTTEPGRRVFLLWELVRRHRERGEDDAAADWALRLADAAPEDREAVEVCAELLAGTGRDADRVRILGRLDRMLSGPAQAEIRRRIADTHRRLGDIQAAIDAWLGALDADPDDRESMRALLEPLRETGGLRDLARVYRSLAERAEPRERAELSGRLAALLADELDDADAAVVVLWRLVDDPDAPHDVDRRLEELLERTGRYEELAQRLADRRHTVEDDSPEAVELDLRRAAVLGGRLHQYQQATPIYRQLLDGLEIRGADELRDAVLDGLEACARGAADEEELVWVLARRAAACDDPTSRDALQLERAKLLEETLERPAEACEVYAELVDAAGPGAADARERLLILLERLGDWAELRERLEEGLEDADDAARLALHRRLAELCAERLDATEAAIAHLEATARLAPDDPDSWRTLADRYLAAGRIGDAVAALESELGLGPDVPREVTLRARAAALCADDLSDPQAARGHYERLLEIDPGHADAVAFLAAAYEREDRTGELQALLRSRLERLEANGGADLDRGAELRIRLAELEERAGGGPDAAIATLTPALGERVGAGARGAAAIALAELYARAGRTGAGVELARRMVGEAHDPATRADWNLRLGSALRQQGDGRGAVAAYREVLGLRPGDPRAERTLRDLYRELGDAEPLARLLEAQLSGLAGPAEVPVRLELVELLAEQLDRPAEGLLHLRRVLEIEPDHREALERGIAVAESLGAADVLIELLDHAVDRERRPAPRATLLARRGHVLAGPLGRIPESVASFREAVTLQPDDAGLRRGLRDALQRAGEWSSVLDEIQVQARMASGAERVALLEEGVGIAAEHLSADASLPWLERLRNERPEDVAALTRIADVHRRAGRPEPLLRTLEAEVALCAQRDRRRELHLERSRLLERDLGSPARALAALESARREDPNHLPILEELDRLYAEAGRRRERAEILEQRIAGTPAAECGALHRAAAELYLDDLGQPERAAEHLARALETAAGPQAALLQARGRALRRSGQVAAWSEVSEQELALLDPNDPVFAERRRALHRELASAYAHELGDPDAALAHLRALVDTGDPDPDDELAVSERDAAERALLQRLRAEAGHAELATRLARRLERHPDDPAGWLELARLCEERIHEPGRAAEAYARALEQEPGGLDALRGLRRVAERRGDWEEVARCLEREIEVRGRDGDASPAERAALHRALGEVAWHRLQATTRASRAYACALECLPGDLEALRALQALCEAMEDWRGALDFYASELELLGDDETGRRRDVQLRIASLARDRLDDLPRAIAALEAADGIAQLDADARRGLAGLLQRHGDTGRFAEVMTDWCADPAARPDAGDRLALAEALESLERPEEALAVLETALAADAEDPRLWLAAGRLRRGLDDPAGAAEALVSAAAHSPDGPASQQLLEAASLVEEDRPDRALAWLRSAVEREPGSARVHAELARVAEPGEPAEALAAAARALDLASAAGGGALEPEQRLATALVGARAARAVDDLEEAARFATTARALEPASAEALAMEGEVLFAMGEIAGARRALETRLDAAADYPGRARHLALLGAALEAAGEPAPALARYQEALAADADLDEARAGVVRLHERAGRMDEALEALLAWAERAGPEGRARHLARAAEIELARGGDDARAEAHLRRALEADASNPEACLLLTTRLAEAGRSDEALELSGPGLERAADGDVAARLAALRARIFEQRGDRRAAADAFGAASEADPSACHAALAGARILRALGEWQDAADALGRFTRAHPGDDPAGLAQVHFQRGRLLAGPLERVDEGLDAYRAALDANPRYRDAHEALAGLLIHRRECWDEALARHRELLEGAPADVPFLRGVLRIAEGRGDDAGGRNGRALLRALGAASPEESAGAPERLELRVGEPARLENPVWEAARRVAVAAADEIARALDASVNATGAEAGADPQAAFRAHGIAAEGRLSAPALVPVPADELGEVLRITAGLATEANHVHGDGNLVNRLAHELGRRSRRRVKRELGEVPATEIAEIDFERWRRELRALAHAEALDAIDGDLRSALLALVETGDDGTPRRPGPEADLCDLVTADPAASALLRRVVLGWIDGL